MTAEQKFEEKVDELSDLIGRGVIDCFLESHFTEFKPAIENWDVLLEVIKEEYESGWSDRWDEIKFAY